MEARALLASIVAQRQWFWGTTVTIVGVLVLANLVLFLIVFGRRLRELRRAGRAKRFERECEQLLDEVAGGRDLDRLAARIRRFDELERPIAATMLLERLGAASGADRAAVLDALRQAGAIDLLVRSLHRRAPWRRALAARTLGQLGAAETVPELVERLFDRSRYVREAAVRALGRIGDERALASLADLFLRPGRAGAGIVYEALLGFGADSVPVFRKGLASPEESVRVTASFGIGAVAAPEEARTELERMLTDPAGEVRAAACETLGRIPGATVPEALLQATRDTKPSVRRAAAGALGSYDDPSRSRFSPSS